MIRAKSGLMQLEIAPPQTKDVFVVRTIFTLKLYTPFPFSCQTSWPVFQVSPWNGSDFVLCADPEL